MRGTDATSRQIDRPDGVVTTFQVSEYKVEPSERILACNLLSHDDGWATGPDELKPRWPEVPFVFEAALFSGDRETLTWAATGPEGPTVVPSRET